MVPKIKVIWSLYVATQKPSIIVHKFEKFGQLLTSYEEDSHHNHSCSFKFNVMFSNVLVHLGCYNKISLTRCLYRNLFVTVLEAEKFKIKVLEDSMSGVIPLSGSQISSFCCTLMWQKKVRELSGAFFMRVRILFLRVPPL